MKKKRFKAKKCTILDTTGVNNIDLSEQCYEMELIINKAGGRKNGSE